MADARIALDVVSHRRAEGVPQPVSNDPTVTPKTMRIDVGYDWVTGEMQTRTVPAGEMSIPGFARLGKKWQPTMQVMQQYGNPVLYAQVMRGNQDEANGLFQYVREYLDGHSIYLGQAVTVDFEFIDLTSFKPENVALTDTLRNAVDLFVRGPLQFQAALDAENMPRKTGVFLWGPPGGGKTMVKTTCAYIGARMGAVVVDVDPSLGIEGFEMAAKRTERLLEAGHKVMIVMEDMEKLSRQNRAKVLDILDGTSSKGARRIVIGTTNFLEQIDRAMLRPGRFDCVEFCGLPDLTAFRQLCKVQLPDRDLSGVDFEAAFPYFEGYSYAFISNAIQNVVRSAVNRAKGELEEGWSVTTEDLISAAQAVRGHFDLMQQEVVVESVSMDSIFRQHVLDGVEEYLSNNDVSTESDNTDYSEIRDIVHTQVDEIVEGRLNEAAIYKPNGDTLGVLHTQ
jgi:transitional endoplasmic reticulum ATPase